MLSAVIAVTGAHPQSISELWGTIAETSLLGMGTVFAVLIILWGILELMKVFFYTLPNKRKAEAVAAVSAPSASVEITPEPQNLTDDLELVAVISAAVAASMGGKASSSGFIVRSIRRSGKWSKA